MSCHSVFCRGRLPYHVDHRDDEEHPRHQIMAQRYRYYSRLDPGPESRLVSGGEMKVEIAYFSANARPHRARPLLHLVALRRDP